MKIDYLVIQAGGLGSRLGAFTKNKPKALLSISGKSMIIRLMESFRDSRIIIIADYKAIVLKRYLEAFSSLDYYILTAEQKGNSAGLRAAVEFIPKDASVAVTWCDLVFPDGFSVSELPAANYIGTLSGVACSWGFLDATLLDSPVKESGVAGFFLFKDKGSLGDIPEAGSFTRWLAENQDRFNFQELTIESAVEYGTIDALQSLADPNPSRPYNKLVFDELLVTKTAVTAEGAALLQKEVSWYREANKLGFAKIPSIRSFDPLVIERLYCPTIAGSSLSRNRQRSVLGNIIESLKSLHALSVGAVDVTAMYNNYYRKTLKRLDAIRAVLPMAEKSHIVINGAACRNILDDRGLFERAVLSIIGNSKFGFIHGDCTFSNIFIKDDDDVVFIDARGYFSRDGLLGDVDYDWAKLYFSLVGGFDHFNRRRFSIDISDDSVFVSVDSSGWEWLADDFVKIAAVDLKKIRLIHAIVWMSLASHCSDDFDSMAAAFYIGLFEFNRWRIDYGSKLSSEQIFVREGE